MTQHILEVTPKLKKFVTKFAVQVLLTNVLCMGNSETMQARSLLALLVSMHVRADTLASLLTCYS